MIFPSNDHNYYFYVFLQLFASWPFIERAEYCRKRIRSKAMLMF